MAYKYKAFISYRHRPTDKFVASKIQNLLEGFRLKGTEPWKLFRDEAELPTSSSLSDDIENALKNSEFLIVICTPALKESRWCMREITTFKALHGGSTDNILPVLVEGDPDAVFPDQLKTTVKLVKNPITGESVKREVEIEPLAANVCGANQSEINKKLKVEYLRLAAALSGRGFDDLYNRKRRKQIRRISLAAGILMAAAVAFGAYNFSMNLQLEDKNRQISEQLHKTLMANAEALNGQAEALYDNGRVRDAVETMLAAYELNDDHSAMVPATDLILASQIGAFSAETVLPCVRLPHMLDVKAFYFRNDGHRLVTIDAGGNVSLWNADSGAQVKQWKNVSNGLNQITCLVQDSHSVASPMSMEYLLKGMVHGTQTNTANLVFYGFRQTDADSEIPAEEDDHFILYSAKELRIVDAVTGEEKQIHAEDLGENDYSFSDWGGSIVAYTFTKSPDNVLVLSPEDGSVLRKMTIDVEKMGAVRYLTDHYVLTTSVVGRNITALSDQDEDTYEDMTLENEDMERAMNIGICQIGPYIVDVEKGTTGKDSIDFDTIRFVVYDTDGVKQWTFSDSLYVSYLDGVQYIPADANALGRGLLLLVYGNRSNVCDAATGEVLDGRSYEEEVLDYRVGSTGMVEVILCNGTVVRHFIGDPYTKQIADTGAKPKQMKACADKLAVVTESGAKNVDLYIRKENTDAGNYGSSAEITGDEDASVLHALLSADARTIYSKSASNEIYSYRVADRQTRLLYAHDDYIYDVYELQNALALCGYQSITMIDKKDGSILADHVMARGYYYLPETQELAYYADPVDSGYEIRFSDGINETVYPLEKDSINVIKNIFFSEDGKRFAIVNKEISQKAEGYREIHSVLLCGRDDETGPCLMEMAHKEAYVCNVRFSPDNQFCFVSLNMQNMSEEENAAPGVMEVFDCASGKYLYTYETNSGMIIDECVIDGNIYLLCADYTLEVLNQDGERMKCVTLDEKDQYKDLTDSNTGFQMTALDNGDLLIYNTNRGFVVDIEKERLRLLVEDETVSSRIGGFRREENRIVIANPWQISSYPIYSSNELYQKAKELLQFTSVG